MSQNMEELIMIYKSTFVLIALFSIFLFGCEKSVENSAMGKLSIELTDTPFPIKLVSEANVTINMIEVRKVQAESAGNPFLVLSEDEFSYNLLDLQNGLTADLVEIEVPAGEYDLIRLYVSSAEIKLTDKTVYDLELPSGDETGIKTFIKPSINVVGGLTTELVLDFDVSQSFVVQGDPFTPDGINGFTFKPVIRVANKSTTGSIKGKVTDTTPTALEAAEVWIEDNGNIFKTFSDDEGLYTLSFIPAGTYTINATKSTVDVEYETVSIENVEVMAGNATQLADIVLTQK
jgi:hypothetical protein